MSTAHEILNVSTTASDEEIKLAYKRACMKHHPDRGGSLEMFQKIQLAYEQIQEKICTVCHGKGFITERRGFFSNKRECPQCWKK